jgi:hypothetical protein
MSERNRREKMTTITIMKKANGKELMTLKSATRRMAWADDYEYAFDQGDNLNLLQKGAPAAMEYILEDGDEIIEVDADGNEIARCVWED